MLRIKNNIYETLILSLLYGGAKNTQWGTDSLFNEWCWVNWAATRKRMKLDHLLTPHTKMTSNCIDDLNVRPESTALRGENTGSKLLDIGLDNEFFGFDIKSKGKQRHR